MLVLLSFFFLQYSVFFLIIEATHLFVQHLKIISILALISPTPYSPTSGNSQSVLCIYELVFIYLFI